MYRISTHPILDVTEKEKVTFRYEGHLISGEKGFTIAAALHQAGFPVHSHSLTNRKRSLECGIGKCGACEMLVDGQIKRICVTKVDGVREVRDIPLDYKPGVQLPEIREHINVYRTKVVIIGAGPSGLAVRETLQQAGVHNIVLDNNSQIGGQFLMQTHQFFFFEKQKKYGGMRGFDIADSLAGDNHDNIFLNCTVWDLLENNRVAVKNLETGEIFYIDTQFLVVATGAVPFMPPFENDDLPGVYTAAVVQKMMNTQLTLLGKNVLTVGAGNIGYLTSYQLMQAGVKVKAILEAKDEEGGFPVQANRIKRLGVPILLEHILIKAIPNDNHDGIVGAVIAQSKNFEPIEGTEKIIRGIEAINICTGLVPDSTLLTKGCEVFGRHCYGVGDAVRIGEGTSAVLHGKRVAYEIIQELNLDYDHNEYLAVSKEYIDSQQHPVRILEAPVLPDIERQERPFVLIDCLYGFACNPCAFACPFGAISKSSTSSVPEIDYDKCTGCMQCISQCPGLAMFGYDLQKRILFLPVEREAEEGKEVYLVGNDGRKLGAGHIMKIIKKPNKTNIVKIQADSDNNGDLLQVRGYIEVESYPENLFFEPNTQDIEAVTYICHCDDVKLDEILDVVGKRNYITIEEIKHTTRLGMGACRGKRCIGRLKPLLASKGIQVIGEATPRAPLSNQVTMGELYIKDVPQVLHTQKLSPTFETEYLVAGGGIGGSALFRYLSEAGLKPMLVNYGFGASWRNIAGGRNVFTRPELSEIASQNKSIFEDLNKKSNVDYCETDYVTFVHDRESYNVLDASRAWSDAVMIEPSDFSRYISPYMNPNLKKYIAAMITKGCWQASPGKVIDLLRTIGKAKEGRILEDCKLVDIDKTDTGYTALVYDHNRHYHKINAKYFINALGSEAEKFADKLGYSTGLYAVKHQAFITRRMPFMGIDKKPLGMLIDRRNYKGFTAVYGQQLQETGQIIGCATPLYDPQEVNKDLKVNTDDFMRIISEVFIDWIPELSSVGLQAVWAGNYVEPRIIIDTQRGLFVGLRGQGFMLGQYLAKLYVDKLLGKEVPEYFHSLSLEGEGLSEEMLK